MNAKSACLLGLLTALVAGCGVRGRPLPPETPPPLGRGEPSFKKATEKVVLPAKKKREAPPDDWNEPEDFREGE
ncbi:MAG: hypothetical protein KF681_12435 [Bdellovibrionaceae bacterium]|nr:hypothetical protein [Pseudobdellovibrionaceae bacterium]